MNKLLTIIQVNLIKDSSSLMVEVVGIDEFGQVERFVDVAKFFVIVKVVTKKEQIIFQDIIHKSGLEFEPTKIKSGTHGVQATFYKVFIKDKSEKFNCYERFSSALVDDDSKKVFYTTDNHLTSQYLKENLIQLFDTVSVNLLCGCRTRESSYKVLKDKSFNLKIPCISVDIEKTPDSIIQIGFVYGILDTKEGFKEVERGCFHYDDDLQDVGNYCPGGEKNIVQAFYDKLNTLNPLLIFGHNFIAFDQLELENVINAFDDKFIVFDTLLMFKKHYCYDKEFNLKALCNKYLKSQNKDDVTYSEIANYWDQTILRRKEIVNYCIQDCLLLPKLVVASNLLHLAINHSRLYVVPFNLSLSLTQDFESVFFNKFGDRIGRDFPDFSKYDKYEGGRWISFKKIFHKNVVEWDATGMYQNIFILNELSTENLTSDTFAKNHPDQVRTFHITLDGKKETFHFLKGKGGWIVEFQKELQDKRNQLKARMKIAYENGDIKLGEMLNQEQNQVKLMGNVPSGMMKTLGCVPIIAVICDQGRKGIGKVEKYILDNKLGEVVYIATDGIYTEFKDGVNLEQALNEINDILVDVSMKNEGLYPHLIAKIGKKNTLTYTEGESNNPTFEKVKKAFMSTEMILFASEYLSDPERLLKFTSKGSSLNKSSKYSKIEGDIYESIINFILRTDMKLENDVYFEFINLAIKNISESSVEKLIIKTGANAKPLMISSLGNSSIGSIWYQIITKSGIKTFPKIDIVHTNKQSDIILDFLSSYFDKDKSYFVEKDFKFLYTESPTLTTVLDNIDYAYYSGRIVKFVLEYFPNSKPLVCLVCNQIDNKFNGKYTKGKMVKGKFIPSYQVKSGVCSDCKN